MTNFTTVPDMLVPGVTPPTPGENRVMAIGWGTAVAVTCVYVLVTTALFCRIDMGNRDIQHRSRYLTILHAVGVFGYTAIAGTSSAMQNIGGFPCSLKIWGSFIFGALHMSSFTVRVLRFIFEVQINRDKLEAKPHRPDFNAMHAAEGQLPPSLAAPTAALNGSKLYRSGTKANWMTQFLRSNRVYFETERGCLMTVLICVILAIIYLIFVQILCPEFGYYPIVDFCPLSWHYVPLLAALLFNSFIAYPYFLRVIWHVQDGFGIRREIIACCTTIAIGIIITLIWGLAPGSHRNYFSTMCWNIPSLLLVHTMIVTVPLIRSFQQAERRVSYTDLAASTSSVNRCNRFLWNNYLSMLCEPAGVSQIKLWAANLFCSELAIFLEEYQELKTFLANIYPPPSHRQSITLDSVLSDKTMYPLQDTFPYPEGDSEFAIPLSPLSSEKRQHPPPPVRRPSQMRRLYPEASIGGDGYHGPLAELGGQAAIDLGSPSEILHTIRDTWNLSPATRVLNSEVLTTTPLIRSEDAKDGPDDDHGLGQTALNIQSHSSLKLAYYMFYQRFVAKAAELRVPVAIRLLEAVELKVVANELDAGMFDDIHDAVLKMLFSDVYLRSVKW
ncbi:hypothetical protein H4R34_003446 [Dimargaris verticillata]|uniref:RGS domain-containing protein n=1 Tax=Dimargaris verticillata TaxID=2761393 RepID=A0A9W8B248_9FUNG|nr:hypothetical protein H4R34_003446 [Dimargaris verticillata]